MAPSRISGTSTTGRPSHQSNTEKGKPTLQDNALNPTSKTMSSETEVLVAESPEVPDAEPWQPPSDQTKVSGEGRQSVYGSMSAGDRDPLSREPGINDPGVNADIDNSELTQSMISQDRLRFGTTNLQSLMHLLKGNIGTGILAMPSAIKNAGLWTGVGGLAVMGIIAIHCMHLLVNCSRYLCEKTGCTALDYGRVAETAFEEVLHSSPRKKKISAVARNVVNVFLCLTQFGFCTVYILFVAQNLCQVFHAISPVILPLRLYEFFILLLLVPYVLIRNLRHLAPFSTLANLLTVAALIITLQYCFRDLPPVTSYPAFNSWRTLPLYFGIAIYAFEGIGVVLPIENKMKHPEDFGGATGVLNTGMVIVTVLYVAVGFYGYMKFGDYVKGSITLNLPADDWLYLSVKLMISLAIFITYGLQFYVPIYVIWPSLKESTSRPWLRKYGEYVLRLVTVVITFLLAIVIPHLDLLISLIGSVASSTLALIFPPILEVLTLYPDGKLPWYRLLKDIVICCIGVLGFLAGTATTLQEIVSVFQNPPSNINSTDPCFN